ncbi:MAG TPA: helix-turn-helix transcriptional regulator [Aldersonia sp.]
MTGVDIVALVDEGLGNLEALADPARAKPISLTSDGGQETTGRPADVIGLSEPTVSHHLTQLHKAGLIDSTRRGMRVCHRGRSDAPAALCTVLDPDCCRRFIAFRPSPISSRVVCWPPPSRTGAPALPGGQRRGIGCPPGE